jgi:hypothetical protein
VKGWPLDKGIRGGEVGRGVDGATVIVIPIWPVVNLSPRVGPLVGDDL